MTFFLLSFCMFFALSSFLWLSLVSYPYLSLKKWLRGWCWQILTRDFPLQHLINLFIYLSHSQIFVDVCNTPLKQLICSIYCMYVCWRNINFLICKNMFEHCSYKSKHFIFLMDFHSFVVFVPPFLQQQFTAYGVHDCAL